MNETKRFYKVVDEHLRSMHDPAFQYEIGKSKRVAKASKDQALADGYERDEMYSGWLLYASKTPEAAGAFIYRWPARLLVVEGIPVAESGTKRGFRQLRIIEETGIARCFGPNGAAVVDVLNTIAAATLDQSRRLAIARHVAVAATWATARHAAVAAAWAAAYDVARGAAVAAAWHAAWHAAWATARQAAKDAVRDATLAAAVADLAGQHGLEQHHIETLVAPYVEVFGRPE